MPPSSWASTKRARSKGSGHGGDGAGCWSVERVRATRRTVHSATTSISSWTASGRAGVSLGGMSVAARPLFAFDNTYVRELEGLSVPWHGRSRPRRRCSCSTRRWPPSSGPTRRRCGRPRASRCSSATPSPRARRPSRRPTPATSSAATRPRLGDGRALLLGEVDRRARPPARPPPQGLGPHAVRPRRRRQGGGRPDAARVRDRRGDARARHPDDARARGRRDGRAGRARDAAARRGARPRRRQPPAGRHLRVRRRARRPGRSSAASPTTRSPATTRTPPTPTSPYLAFFEAVRRGAGGAVARWMLVGFVHGVMNTDNMTISGETIDYGPCAFMDAFDPATVFSSIDHGGRYAYGNQPPIAQWNLARLRRDAAAADRRRPGRRRATPRPRCCRRSPSATTRHWLAGHARQARPAGRRHPATRRSSTTCSRCCTPSGVDFTAVLPRAVAPCCAATRTGARLFADPAAFDAGPRAGAPARPRPATAGGGRDGPRQPGLHPAQPPRRGGARRAATAGDLAPFERAARGRSRGPFDERPGLERYAEPAPDGFGAPTGPSAAPEPRGRSEALAARRGSGRRGGAQRGASGPRVPRSPTQPRRPAAGAAWGPRSPRAPIPTQPRARRAGQRGAQRSATCPAAPRSRVASPRGAARGPVVRHVPRSPTQPFAPPRSGPPRAPKPHAAASPRRAGSVAQRSATRPGAPRGRVAPPRGSVGPSGPPRAPKPHAACSAPPRGGGSVGPSGPTCPKAPRSRVAPRAVSVGPRVATCPEAPRSRVAPPRGAAWGPAVRHVPRSPT